MLQSVGRQEKPMVFGQTHTHTWIPSVASEAHTRGTSDSSFFSKMYKGTSLRTMTRACLGQERLRLITPTNREFWTLFYPQGSCGSCCSAQHACNCTLSLPPSLITALLVFHTLCSLLPWDIVNKGANTQHWFRWREANLKSCVVKAPAFYHKQPTMPRAQSLDPGSSCTPRSVQMQPKRTPELAQLPTRLLPAHTQHSPMALQKNVLAAVFHFQQLHSGIDQEGGFFFF